MDRLLKFSVVLLLSLLVVGCVVRPSPSVLRPVAAPDVSTRVVSVLTVTNRVPAHDGGYGNQRATGLSYELYEIAVPPNARPGDIRYSEKGASPQNAYVVISRVPLTRAQFLKKTSASIGSDGTTAMFVHGYNQSFQEALFRVAQVTSDAAVAATPIMFSWPSEASLLGYLADRDASLASRNDLVETIRLVAGNPGIKRLGIVGHSMGAFLLMEAIQQIKLENGRAALAKLAVALAAPDIDPDVFGAQMQTVGRLDPPMAIMVSKTDRALQVSSLLGNDRPRLGMLDVNDPAVRQISEQFGVAIIDISSVHSADAFGHDGFASVAQFAKQLAVSEGRREGNVIEAGLFVFDATRAVITSPLN